jgi:hypothetical protein
MRRLAMLSLMVLPGCFRLYSMLDDTGTAEAPIATIDPAAPPDKSTVRSYGNPDVALSNEERADIALLCSTIVSADNAHLSGEAEAAHHASFKTTTEWGKTMHLHLIQSGRKVVAPRLARLLSGEGLKWSTPDCRTVVNRFSGYN